MASSDKLDLVIAGGGLAGGLIALALKVRRPEVRLALIEQDAALGGHHVWSFFDSDIAEPEHGLVAPLVCHRWTDNEVRFPAHRRVLAGTYNSIESERLDQVVRATVGNDAIVSGRIVALDCDGATLADGRRIAARGVIDARGIRAAEGLDLGWQKFLGQLLRLEAPHGLERPVIMDATVDQADGYRFVYLLPFGPDRVFVEDTYYNSTADFDPDRLRGRIADYAAAQGWRIAAVEREEQAALPIVMGGSFAALWPARDRIARAGMAAGLFQPMTGYSLPDAVRTAALVASLPDLSSPALRLALRSHAKAAWESRGIYRLLARMLFRAADPPDRYRTLERFYRLDAALIDRFYAGTSTFADKARILIGKPPVPLHRAIAQLRETR